ncbi:hypothetical protein [Mahella australiensis]|uniref:Uncharacterized protein n=1 Tax=Mahella australiensis (strain DSM 15567 / CIP 107919 / 50-1 BON) TaxID=697281 RepID=F3ZWX0_MAHA5|nr:hypothetical protein [Mahella australiensis]AEE97592.1 hypothetical protein Mahau_2430 [Mahella australiensis 50-1 BON]
MSVQDSKEEILQLIEILPEEKISQARTYLKSLIDTDRDKNIERIQQIMHKYVRSNRILSEELIVERRKEAKNE